MRIFVDNNPVDLLPGMTVRHALLAAGHDLEALNDILVSDEWGNLLGLDGALAEDMRLVTRIGGWSEGS